MRVVHFPPRKSRGSKILDRLAGFMSTFVIPPLVFGGMVLVIVKMERGPARDLGMLLVMSAFLWFCTRARVAK